VNNKSLSCAFLAVILIGVLILANAMRFGIVQASTDVSGITKPSVPEVTVEIVSGVLDVSIKNQPFVPYYDASSGWNISFYYNIRMKGHFSEEWIELYRASDGYPSPSDSEYTVISLGTLGENGLSLLTNAKMIDVPADAKVDFQVEAMIGYVSRVYNSNATSQLDMYPWQLTGETSGWSETRTITIPTTSPSPTNSPSPTPTSSPSPIPVPGQSFFYVESNSTVTELFFNSTNSELSFTVSGESETAGYVKVTIAKSLISSVQNVKVYLDGNQLDVAITSNEDSWLLSFTYMHSTHHVRISLATNAATTLLGIESWIWIGVVIIIVVIGVGLLLYIKKRKH
jgi:hypothetical protein